MEEIVRLGKPDGRGNFKRELGWKAQDEEFIQHRFYVGKDREQAVQRILRLERLWANVGGAWNTELMPFAVRRVYPCPVWTVHTLAIGMAIARGDETVEVDPAADP